MISGAAFFMEMNKIAWTKRNVREVMSVSGQYVNNKESNSL